MNKTSGLFSGGPKAVRELPKALHELHPGVWDDITTSTFSPNHVRNSLRYQQHVARAQQKFRKPVSEKAYNKHVDRLAKMQASLRENDLVAAQPRMDEFVENSSRVGAKIIIDRIVKSREAAAAAAIANRRKQTVANVAMGAGIGGLAGGGAYYLAQRAKKMRAQQSAPVNQEESWTNTQSTSPTL